MPDPAARPSARQRGYNTHWEAARRTYLRSHPWCVMCAKAGQKVLASHVDHIRPHRGDQALFWDKGNWQGLCVTHHNGSKQRQEKRGYSGAIGEDGWQTDPDHPFNR